VKGGWNGLPEEQGFLRDIQGAACDQFYRARAGLQRPTTTTIHVDLMRRASGIAPAIARAVWREVGRTPRGEICTPRER
jgi:hypothetical protein